MDKRLSNLICKVSNSAYKIMREERYGIAACCGVLTEEEVLRKTKDIELLKYYSTHDLNGCDLEQLIEKLT